MFDDKLSLVFIIISLNDLSNRKSKKNLTFSDIEENVVKWFKPCRDSNVSICGPILKEKVASKFKKKRYYIAFRKVCGESMKMVSDNKLLQNHGRTF